jgi:hypothetical protein
MGQGAAPLLPGTRQSGWGGARPAVLHAPHRLAPSKDLTHAGRGPPAEDHRPPRRGKVQPTPVYRNGRGGRAGPRQRIPYSAIAARMPAAIASSSARSGRPSR